MGKSIRHSLLIRFLIGKHEPTFLLEIMFYVYLLRSEAAKKIYVGLTNDLQRRLEQHNAGENISTKPYRPWKLIYHEASMTYQLAESREHRLKYHGNALRELSRS